MRRCMTLTPYAIAWLLLTSGVFAQGKSTTGEQHMTIDRNKQVIQRLFGEVFNQKSLSAIIELYDPDVVDHSAFPDQESGINGIKSAIQGFFELFDNLNVTVKDIIAEGDKVATRETWKGIYKPTGEPAEGSVIHIFRVREGKISDEWSKGWEWIEEL